MIHVDVVKVPSDILQKFIDDTISPAVKASVLAACNAIQESAKAMCPVDTGALRDSIVVDVQQVAFTSVTGTVGPNMPYADYVEYGTGQRGDPSAPYGHVMTWPGMPAQPYMRPALDENRDSIKDFFQEQISAAVG